MHDVRGPVHHWAEPVFLNHSEAKHYDGSTLMEQRFFLHGDLQAWVGQEGRKEKRGEREGGREEDEEEVEAPRDETPNKVVPPIT